jgi:hypothetical protein
VSISQLHTRWNIDLKTPLHDYVRHSLLIKFTAILHEADRRIQLTHIHLQLESMRATAEREREREREKSK